MLHIVICEDDSGQRVHIESIINTYISAHADKYKLALSTGNPMDVLDYINSHVDKRGLYFLDIDLKHDKLNGLKLAALIKAADPYAKIVFITTHSELAYLTYEHKLKAMDFIVKGNLQNMAARVTECMATSYNRYLEEEAEQAQYFTVDANGEAWSIAHNEITFFETNSRIRHRIILHTESCKIDFRGFLSEIEQHIPEFYRCHKSFLVNIKKISYVDKITKEAVMANGERVHVAEKKISELVRLIGDR